MQRGLLLLARRPASGSSERSAASDWRAIDAAWARQRRISRGVGGGEAGAAEAVGRVGVHGDDPRGQPGLEGVGGSERFNSPSMRPTSSFASFAEQRGFVGTSILLLLYLLVVWRGLRVVTVAGDLYGAVVAGGIVFAFLFQVFVNVGMTMGIAPVTGIPLPLSRSAARLWWRT